MQVTAVVNQKGGLGKTTTAINIGRTLARAGRRVLLVDTDEQGALTFHLLGGEGDDLASLYNVIGSHPLTSLTDAITSTDVERIDVIPANDDLARTLPVGGRLEEVRRDAHARYST